MIVLKGQKPKVISEGQASCGCGLSESRLRKYPFTVMWRPVHPPERQFWLVSATRTGQKSGRQVHGSGAAHGDTGDMESRNQR